VILIRLRLPHRGVRARRLRPWPGVWCQLRERDVHPRSDGFFAETWTKYRGLLKHLYRTFEALRGEERLLPVDVRTRVLITLSDLYRRITV